MIDKDIKECLKKWISLELKGVFSIPWPIFRQCSPIDVVKKMYSDQHGEGVVQALPIKPRVFKFHEVSAFLCNSYINQKIFCVIIFMSVSSYRSDWWRHMLGFRVVTCGERLISVASHPNHIDLEENILTTLIWQSCEMSRIWRIYSCKKMCRLG